MPIFIEGQDPRDLGKARNPFAPLLDPLSVTHAEPLAICALLAKSFRPRPTPQLVVDNPLWLVEKTHRAPSRLTIVRADIEDQPETK